MMAGRYGHDIELSTSTTFTAGSMNSLDAIESAITGALSRSEGAQFAAIDFDNTCIFNDIAEAALAFMCRNRILKNRRLRLPNDGASDEYHHQVFRHYYDLCRRGEFKQAYIFCARAFAGHTLDEIDTLVATTLEFEGTSVSADELFGVPIARGISVRPTLSALLDYLSKNAIQIWIVSAAPESVVECAARRLGIPGSVVGVKLGIDNGVLADHLQEPYPMFDGKVECIRKYIEPYDHPIFSIGDSANDLAMINYAIVKAIVSNDLAFMREAKYHGWHILRDESLRKTGGEDES